MELALDFLVTVVGVFIGLMILKFILRDTDKPTQHQPVQQYQPRCPVHQDQQLVAGGLQLSHVVTLQCPIPSCFTTLMYSAD